MTPRENLSRLGALTRMVLDVKLAGLTKAARAREVSLAHLSTLERPAAEDGLHPVAQQLAALAYDRWAEARRAEINQVLSRQTAEWLQARTEAGLAFGRAEVLRKLAEKAP